MKIRKVFIAFLCSNLMFGCSQQQYTAGTTEETIDVKELSSMECQSIQNTLEEGNFKVTVLNGQIVQIDFEDDNWEVYKSYAYYSNRKINCGDYFFLEDYYSSNASEESQQLLKENYDKKLKELGLTADDIAAYGIYLINNYDSLEYKEYKDDSDNTRMDILKPEVTVTGESLKAQFPLIFNLASNAGYRIWLEDGTTVKLEDDNNNGFYVSFTNNEAYPVYKNSEYEYNIKNDTGVDDSLKPTIQNEYISLLANYGLTIDDIDNFAGYLIDHYYETEYEISYCYEEPAYLFIL